MKSMLQKRPTKKKMLQKSLTNFVLFYINKACKKEKKKKQNRSQNQKKKNGSKEILRSQVSFKQQEDTQRDISLSF